jgi:transposase InsO family protein
MKKYPDLIRNIKLSRADELWVSDITYIRLVKREFGYLSLITDAYSRKIVGFCMHYNLSAYGPLQALQMALAGRSGNQSLIHHSDRGSQYCSDDYVSLLNKNAISISMTQSGNPKDNAIAERVNGILKQELLKDIYPDMQQARRGVETAVDIYNRLRPHSSVDMLTPEKAHSKTGEIKRRWRGLIRNLRKPAPDIAAEQQPGFQQKKEV